VVQPALAMKKVRLQKEGAFLYVAAEEAIG
jgi:hypothetical protein